MISETLIDRPIDDTDYGYKPMCQMCEKSVATSANNSLCIICWAECEGQE